MKYTIKYQIDWTNIMLGAAIQNARNAITITISAQQKQTHTT